MAGGQRGPKVHEQAWAGAQAWHRQALAVPPAQVSRSGSPLHCWSCHAARCACKLECGRIAQPFHETVIPPNKQAKAVQVALRCMHHGLWLHMPSAAAVTLQGLPWRSTGSCPCAFHAHLCAQFACQSRQAAEKVECQAQASNPDVAWL